MGACGPPGASRCSARASLRTPSRPHPPHDGASPAPYIPGSEAIGLKGRSAPEPYLVDDTELRTVTTRRPTERLAGRFFCYAIVMDLPCAVLGRLTRNGHSRPTP